VVSLSAIIPARNALPYLQETLPETVRQARNYGPCQVIVVDSGSDDGTESWISSNFPDVCYARSAMATPGAARNEGAKHAGGDYFCFLDADCLISPGYFESVCAVSRGGHQFFGRRYDLPRNPGWIERTWEELHRPSQLKRSKYIPGGNLIVSKKVFLDTGGFNEAMSAGEDAELALRAASQGYAIEQLDSVRVAHLGNPKSLTAFYRQQRWHASGTLYTKQAFLNDRPLQVTIAFMALHVLLVLGLLRGFSVALLAVIPAIPAAVAVIRAPRVALKRPLASSVLYWVYFCARSEAILLSLATFVGLSKPDFAVDRRRS